MESNKSSQKGKTKSRIKFLWQFAKPYKFVIISGEVCLMWTYIIEVIRPLILAAIIDESFYNGNIQFFYKGIIIYLILFTGMSLIWLLYAFTWQTIYNKFVVDIQVKMFEKVIFSKAKFLSNMNLGDVQTRINNDAGQFIHIIQRNVLHAFNTIFSFLLGAFIIFSINKIIGLYLLAAIPITSLLTAKLGKKAAKISKERANRYGLFISRIYEYIKGMRELRLLNARGYAKRFILKRLAKLIRLDIKTSKLGFGINKGNDFIKLVAMLGLYVISAVMIINGNLTIGLFIAVTLYFDDMYGNLSWLSDNYIQWQQRKVFVDRSMDIMSIATEKKNNENEDLILKEGNIQFDNISFCYEKNVPILTDISFDIEKNKKTALVGISGSGKSTITNLLLRFYEPQNGAILIDNQNINDVSLKSLRQSIGIVQQDIQLFSESIRFNVALCDETVTDNMIWKSLKKANIFDFINSLPDKLDSVIKRGGLQLSGGQKQRIMIARIILKNPSILIFDEATSALDYESEQYIREAFENLSKDRTTLIIAHRLSTIMGCDDVLVLKDGKIVSRGTHKELLVNCEHYNEMFRNQYFIGEMQNV